MDSKIDETDKAIIAELIEDSKLSARELSKKLKIHPNTLLQRIKRLEKNGIITKYTTIIDYQKLGFDIQAMIFINVRMGKGWEEDLRPVSRLPEISSFTLLTGDYDALAIVRIKDMHELSAVLRKIQDTGIVAKTTTHMILDHYKHTHEFNPLKEEVHRKAAAHLS